MYFVEHLAAYLALLLALVIHSLVAGQFYRTFTLLAALPTVENLLVHQQMIVQPVLRGELPLAQVARELWIVLLQMRSLVRLEVSHGSTADMAHLPIDRVRVYDVHEYVRLQVEPLAAIVAHESPLGRTVPANPVPLQAQKPLEL